jgi:hypothetical protein
MPLLTESKNGLTDVILKPGRFFMWTFFQKAFQHDLKVFILNMNTGLVAIQQSFEAQ